MKTFSIVFTIFLFVLGIMAQDGAVLIVHDNYLVGAAQNGKWIKDTEVAANFGKTAKYLGFDSLKNEKTVRDFRHEQRNRLRCKTILFRQNG